MFSDLKRYPVIKNDPLRAWDAADELLIQEVKKLNPTSQRILILNDCFGALSVAFSDYQITAYTDSYLSYKATQINSSKVIEPHYQLEHIQGKYSLVLMRIPKNLSFFEDILIRLTSLMENESVLICTSMVKHLPKSAFNLLDKYIGPTRTSLAVKKARLIFSTFQGKIYESLYPMEIELEGFSKKFTHFSNLFSREKLDIGTRFFLEHLPKGDFKKILDLGCANGVVGIKAKELNPKSEIHFTDESYMAIQSSELNYKKFFLDQAYFLWSNSFEDGPSSSFDLVLCNPPFHAQHVVGDFIAKEMFKNAKRVLVEGGKLRVIGNRHLRYHIILKSYFKNVQLVAENSKFVILDAF